MKVIVGIDPGLTYTGYGIIKAQGDRILPVDFGTIKTSTEKRPAQRLADIARELESVLDLHRPEEAGIESLFFTRNSKTAIPVAEARGAIMLCLSMRGIESYDYTPLEVKKAVVGSGRADKRQVQQMVKMILGLAEIPRPDHVADALAVAVCHFHYSHRRRMVEGDRCVQQPER